jgi:hypothetical protein
MADKWTAEALLAAFMKGIDERKLKAGDKKEEAKFRRNAARVARKILREPPEVRARAVNAIKQGFLKLIETIPVITPTITAVFQTISGEDLGSKMDRLIELQDKTRDELGSKIDNLGTKMDKVDSTLREMGDTLHEILIELRNQNRGQRAK